MPVAVLEKGKAPGSHLLSGAVVNPRGLQRLFKGRKRIDELPFYGPVDGESVLFLTQAPRDPHPDAADDGQPPELRRVALAARPLARRGGGGARRDDPAGDRRRSSCSSTAAACSACAPATAAAAGTGRSSANFEPGSDITARVTILAEGTQGHLTGAALERFGLRGENPQVWALGVKEVWKVAKPLDRVIHTMGWPLRPGKQYREFGGSFVYPMGDDMVTIGMVVGLDYRDAELSVHDLLQELKTHPRMRRILEGGERVQWGAKTIPEGGFVALPKRFHAPGLLLSGDGVGLVNVPALKGIHYAIESGRLAAEAAWRTLERGASARDALATYDESLRESFIWSDLQEVRNMRQAFGRGFYVGGALASAMTATKGKFPPGDAPTERDAEQRADHDRPRAVVSGAGREADVRQALERLRVGQPDARRPAEPHPRPDEGAARAGRDVGAHVPGAGLRGRRGRRRRHGRGEARPVELRPVRRDHREGRPPDPARRRQRPRVHAHVARRVRTCCPESPGLATAATLVAGRRVAPDSSGENERLPADVAQ